MDVAAAVEMCRLRNVLCLSGVLFYPSSRFLKPSAILSCEHLPIAWNYQSGNDGCISLSALAKH